MRLTLFSAAAFTAIAMSGLASPSARADYVLNLDSRINGTAPADAKPWVTATFHTVTPGTVTLTLANKLGPTEFLDTALFNVVPTVNPSTLNFAYNSGIQALSIAHASSNTYNGGPQVQAGLFGIDFTYQKKGTGTPSRFYGGDNSVYTITGTGLTESSFKAVSGIDGSIPGGYYGAADILGIPYGNSTISGSISTSAVPEPSTLTLAGLGGLGMIAYAWRRRKANKIAEIGSN